MKLLLEMKENSEKNHLDSYDGIIAIRMINNVFSTLLDGCVWWPSHSPFLSLMLCLGWVFVIRMVFFFDPRCTVIWLFLTTIVDYKLNLFLRHRKVIWGREGRKKWFFTQPTVWCGYDGFSYNRDSSFSSWKCGIS